MHKRKKCNRLGFMQRQSIQAFLRPRNRLLHWNVHWRPKKRPLPSYCHIQHRRKQQIHSCKRLQENRLGKKERNPWKIAFKRDGLNLTNAMMLHDYGTSCWNVSAKQPILLYISSKSLHTQSHIFMKSWKCFHFNCEKRGKERKSDLTP